MKPMGSPLKKMECGSAVIFSWMAACVPACARFRTLLRDTEVTGPWNRTRARPLTRESALPIITRFNFGKSLRPLCRPNDVCGSWERGRLRCKLSWTAFRVLSPAWARNSTEPALFDLMYRMHVLQHCCTLLRCRWPSLPTKRTLIHLSWESFFFFSKYWIVLL